MGLEFFTAPFTSIPSRDKGTKNILFSLRNIIYDWDVVTPVQKDTRHNIKTFIFNIQVH